MEELLNKLIERDMILANDEEAQALAVYANEQGYFSEKFSYRNRPHVSLKRNGPGSISKPLRISTMSMEECNEKIELFTVQLKEVDQTLTGFTRIVESNRIKEDIFFYKSVLKRLQN